MTKEINHDIDNKENILLTAERVFAEKGFKGTTIREVAKQADIAPSLIYYYFKNKGVLYEAIFQHFFTQLDVLFEQNLNTDLDRLSTVKALVFVAIDFATKHRNLMKILTREIIDSGRIGQKISQKYLSPIFDFSTEFLVEGKKEALFREVNPRQFLVSLVGIIVFYFLSDSFLQAAGIGEPYLSKEIEARKMEVWNIVRSRIA